MDTHYRIGDAERAAVQRLLRAHRRAGRLSAEELTDRVAAVGAAVTRAELSATLANLPASVSPAHRGWHDRAWRAHAVVCAVGVVGVMTVWELTRDRTPPRADYGADYWWPLWFALAWGVVLLVHYLRAAGLLRSSKATIAVIPPMLAADGSTPTTPAATHPPLPEIATLTERERQVLALLGEGHANKELAQRLYISERTARTHVSNVLRKLGLTSRTQAALVAVRVALTDEAAPSPSEQMRGSGDRSESK